MLKTLKMKLLIGTFAALAAVSAVVIHHKQAEQTRKEKIAAQLKSYDEQISKDDAEYRKQKEQQQYEQFRKDVEAKKKKNSHAYAGNESKTWTSKY